MNRRVLEWADPDVTIKAAATLSGLEFLRALQKGDIPPPPMALLMNLAIVEVEKGRTVFSATPGPEHYNPHGTIHGGYTATLFDTALGCAVQSSLDRGVGYTTLELHVNYVRAVTHDTGALRCEAHLLHAGKRVATAEGKLFDARGLLVAHATTTCLISPREKKTS